MSKIEDEICQKFIEKKIVQGTFLSHVSIGLEEIRKQTKKRHNEQLTEKEFRMYGGTLSKEIDLLCIIPPLEGLEITEKIFIKTAMRWASWSNTREKLKGRKVWIFEAKSKLDLKAIGQIFAYKTFFSEDNPEVEIEGIGIVCKETDSLLEHVCEKLGINVYKID